MEDVIVRKKTAAPDVLWKGYSPEQKAQENAKLHAVHADLCSAARSAERLLERARWSHSYGT